MNTKKVLFVDDDANILRGLQRMLRSLRKEFNVQFAESGKEALEIMKEDEFDVVVSDMRMPGMDGSQLLTIIQDRYPDSIRIMLTGQADEQSILRTVGVVHHFLAKPCDSVCLKEVLLKASGMHDLLTDVGLKKIVSGLGTLPSLPEVYEKLRQAMADPEVSVADVSKIIEKDIAMSAKVLHLVNSAFFGLFQRVDSPARAVNLLGIDTVKGLVLGVGAFAEINASSKIYPVQKLWTHSMAVGGCAKKIASSESGDAELIDNCFIAGILHDIGKLVLLDKMQDEYEKAVLLADEETIVLGEAEKEIIGTAHDDIGAYLMGLWGMTGSIVEAIGFHHRLSDYPSEGFTPAVAVQVANALYYENRPDEVIGVPSSINMDLLKSKGLDDKVDHWREVCTEFMEQGVEDD